MVEQKKINFYNSYFLLCAFLDSVNQTAALTMSGWKTPQKLAVENTQKCARTHVIEKLGSSSSKCFLCKFRGKCGGEGAKEPTISVNHCRYSRKKGVWTDKREKS